MQPLWKSLAVSLKISHKHTIQPSHSTPKDLLKKNENICLYMDVYSSISHKSEKVETQTSINWWINKMCHPTGILFSNKKEQTTNLYNMNETQKHQIEKNNCNFV